MCPDIRVDTMCPLTNILHGSKKQMIVGAKQTTMLFNCHLLRFASPCQDSIDHQLDVIPNTVLLFKVGLTTATKVRLENIKTNTTGVQACSVHFS